MRRRIIAATTVALIAAVLAAPASSVPAGEGLQTFGDFQCGSLGTVTIFGPAGGGPVGFTTSGLHLVALSFDGTFTDLEGNVFTFSKTYGKREGLTTTYTCTATSVIPGEGTERITVIAGVVPPK